MLHAVRWLSSAWEEISSETIVKCFGLVGFCNSGEQDQETEDDSGLNQVIGSLPLNLQKDLASVNDIKSCDADVIIHDEITCTSDDILEQIFKGMDKKEEGQNCNNSDVKGDSDIVTTNHVRPIPSHNEVLNCVSQLLTYSSTHQPQ
jgi:hypothetical protein